MNRNITSGTEGYSEQAAKLLLRYEERNTEKVYGEVLHLFPEEPSSIVDIGAGTGRDAAYFAGLGHRVLAVEPTREMREPAMLLHPDPNIEWLDDSLPELVKVVEREETFDVVVCNAVWMHLDPAERRRAMERVARLTHLGTRIFLSQRHGPVPPKRRMFDVTGAETIALAEPFGLTSIFEATRESSDPQNRAAGIRWTRVVLEQH